MKTMSMTLLVALVVCVASRNGNAAQDPYDLVIEHVTVIDGVSGERADRSVLIRDEVIVDVVESSKTAIPAVETIDGTGMFLIPGLWDMHVHIVYEEELVEQMPSLFLDYGVTSVRDTGALLEKITPEIARWRSMGPDAPDVFFSGPLLDGSLVVYDGDGRTEIGVSNPAAAAASVQFDRLMDAGVDFIKIYELVSPEVFDALAEAAAGRGLPIAAHVPLSMTAEAAGPRVNSMEHLRNIETACADNAEDLHQIRTRTLNQPGDRSGYELRAHLHATQRPDALDTADPGSEKCRQVIRSLTGTIQVPTLRLNTITRHSPAQRPDWSEHLGRLPDKVAGQWQATADYFAGQTSELGNRMSDWSMALAGEMLRQGVPIGAGTDTPIGQAIPGYSLHTELERLVEAGLTPIQALTSATIRPAEFFHLDDTMGQVRPGMEADLVLLAANPLDDIRYTRRIEAVISDGNRVR